MERALRSLLLLPAILCLTSGSASAAAPFALRARQPDYVATMVRTSEGQETVRLQMTHHGNWTRVESTNNPNREIRYFSADGTTTLLLYGQEPMTSLERGIEQLPDIDYAARDTGERRAYLGESCTMWEVWRTKKSRDGYDSASLSCATDDGIELWQGYRRGNDVTSSVEATRIERRPIAADEVRPPDTLLALDWWDRMTPALAGPEIPDHETVMALSDDPGKSMRTTRRLGPWQFMEQIIGARRQLEVVHDSLQMRFDYASDESGLPKRLTIKRPKASADGAIRPMVAQPAAFRPKDLNRTETILGEACRWFDMMPGMSDAGRHACLTHDGIMLKDTRYGRGSRQEWIAVRVARRPITIDEIKPPADLLAPQLWGIE